MQTDWGDPPPLPKADAFQMPTPGSERWDELFSMFIVGHCVLLPRGVRSMTFREFCQDVAEGLR